MLDTLRVDIRAESTNKTVMLETVEHFIINLK